MSFKYFNKQDNQTVKENFMQNFANYIFEEKMQRNILEIVFLCIGTDRLIGDSFGPLVGSKLEKFLELYNIFNINIFGTLNKNVSYTNVPKYMLKIQKEYPNACIIVIDSALSKEVNIGKIFVKRGKMILAKGLNKAKIEVGDISIKAVVGKNYKLSKYNFLSLQNISLNDVINLSNIVAEGIFEVIKYA